MWLYQKQMNAVPSRFNQFLGHMEIADLLIQNCAHINSKTISDQRTPLHLAAIIGSFIKKRVIGIIGCNVNTLKINLRF